MNLSLNFSIRPYHLADQDKLVTLINTICAEGKWTYTNQFRPTPAWRHALETPGCPCHLLLIVHDQEQAVIGWCDLFPDDTASKATLGIGLLAAYRNQGIGTMLLQYALARARKQKLYKIRLVVNAENLRAIHLYEKFGFQANGIVVPPVPADGTWMEMATNSLNLILCNRKNLWLPPKQA